MELVEIVRNNIKTIRKERGLTQEKVGNFADMSDGHYGKFERDKIHDIQISTLEKIAESFGVEPFVLLVKEYKVANHLEKVYQILKTLSDSELEELYRQLQAIQQKK